MVRSSPPVDPTTPVLRNALYRRPFLWTEATLAGLGSAIGGPLHVPFFSVRSVRHPEGMRMGVRNSFRAGALEFAPGEPRRTLVGGCRTLRRLFRTLNVPIMRAGRCEAPRGRPASGGVGIASGNGGMARPHNSHP